MTAARRHLLLAALALVMLRHAQAATPETVRFAPERDYGPFVFADDQGHVKGLSVDLLARLAPAAGLQLQTLPAAPLAEQLALLRAGGADLVSSLRPTPERAEYLAFTRPYVNVPAILVVRRTAIPHAQGADGQAALQQLAGKPVAVGAGYAVEGFARERFPRVVWAPVPDDVQALQGVQDGRFDAAVVDAASAAFITQRSRMDTLGSAGPIGFDYALSLAVPKARADLVQRLDAAIVALPLQERSEIQQRWMGPLSGSALMQPAWHRLAGWAAAWLGAAALLLGLLWRRRQRRAARDNDPSTLT
ncbi:transporter substrate-binding domain-containing protein [Roseateles cellulosilyticus]|uniref:Transporter substrate-binding domain-containing protein n=1 Tax=Pelomonas cellulosilytica TaxID=2906762 RepID=A0ABS8XX03_9BURK|nr:transporter substrate-binding domain-containing protein [Pelomonas sp. P8]MCE4553815.1 transporter substrate-binding domain-containing protein [Pelomonas sp. P8]